MGMRWKRCLKGVPKKYKEWIDCEPFKQGKCCCSYCKPCGSKDSKIGSTICLSGDETKEGDKKRFRPAEQVVSESCVDGSLQIFDFEKKAYVNVNRSDSQGSNSSTRDMFL